MIAVQDIEKKLKELKPFLASTYHIDKIAYFGSYATGNQTEASDLDILVHFSKPIGWEFFDLQAFLEKELNKKIDLVSVKALKDQLRDIILRQARYI
jgi:predicted nucleotidyltransferase